MIGYVPDCGGADTQAVIEAANLAFGPWRALPAGERSALLERWHALILENVADLGRIMTAEQGKPLAEAEGEIRYAASFVKWFAEEGRRVSGSTVPAPTADRRILIQKEPVGVSAAITPWNFPAAMITRKCAPALAAGCPVVVKPSDLTPFTALALARLAERAGFPKGVLNIVTGMPEAIGAELTASPIVRKLSFTGSTRVGALLMQQCAPTIKRLSLELGGNAPLIVFDDADLDMAVEAAMMSKFRNAGQTCVCANRILVQGGVHDAFAEKFVRRVAELSVGDGFTPGITIGPMIDKHAIEKIEAHVADAVAKGAKVRAGGHRIGTSGTFFEPTVLTGISTDMRVAQEETFGPIAPIIRFETAEQVIAEANDTIYGLAAYFYAENLKRVWHVAEALEYGMVGINTGRMSSEAAPFGGIKQSGIGREGSRHGLEDYLEMKYLCMGNI